MMDHFDSFETYKALTEAGDWRRICEFNGVSYFPLVMVPVLYRAVRKELRVLPNHLESGEVVFALTTGTIGGSIFAHQWLAVLTSERFLFLDAAWYTKAVDSQSIRHEKVQAVSTTQGLFYGSVTIDLGARLITIEGCWKKSVRVMTQLANRWLRVLEKRKENLLHAQFHQLYSAQNMTPPAPETALDQLERLSRLHASGALSDEEFALAKHKILTSL